MEQICDWVIQYSQCIGLYRHDCDETCDETAQNNIISGHEMEMIRHEPDTCSQPQILHKWNEKVSNLACSSTM